MSVGIPRKSKLKSKDNCGVCGRPLIYQTEPISMRCLFCHKTYDTNIYCAEGHYVCDSCHEREALDILRQVVSSSISIDPSEILEAIMSHSSVPMHSPEHHAMVPAVITAAVRNAGYTIPHEAIEHAIIRGAKVPGGWYGFYGACGAAIGVGIAVSIITEATSVTGKQWSLAIEATPFVLNKMADGHPRCSKRASRKALEAAVEFLQDKMGIVLVKRQAISCNYSRRNQECPKENCSYYPRK